MSSSVDDSSYIEVLAPEDVLSDSSVDNARSSPFIVSSPDWSDEDEDCDGGIPEDMDFHFEFLNEKQKVLSRAALYMTREDEFAAFTARRTQSEPNETTTSALWEEAKDLLASMERGGISESSTPVASNPKITTTTVIIPPKRGGPRFPSLLLNTKRPRIDLSVVNHILSCSLEDKNNIMGTAATATGCDAFVSTVLVDGHWMAKALKKYHKIPTLDTSARMPLSSSWGIHKDPFGGGDTVLLNSDIATTDVMDIEQSLTFTATPQLIVTPTPPFSVVHANKAFLVFSGLESHDVIGQAVESLLQNVQQVQDTSISTANDDTATTANNVANSNNFVGWMAQEHRQSMPQLPCHVRVVPVVDRRNNNAASSASKTTSMSHIVLQVQQLEHVLSNAMFASVAAPAAASNLTNTPAMDVDIKSASPPTNSSPGHIFGMIG